MSQQDSPHIITLETFRRTLDAFLARANIGEIQISGGEPFLHPNLSEIVKYCKEKTLNTTVYTSGITNENAIDIDMLKNLKKAGLDKIIFDVQSLDEDDTYDTIMGTQNKLAYLCRSNIAAAKSGLHCEYNFVPMKPNIKSFADILEIAELSDDDFPICKQINILRFVPQGRGRDNKEELMLSAAELESFITHIKSLKTKVPLRIGIPLQENSHECTAGGDKFVVRYDGVILPCPAFKDTPLSILDAKGIPYGQITQIDKLRLCNIKRPTPLCQEIHFSN